MPLIRCVVLTTLVLVAASQIDPIAGTWKPDHFSDWRGAPGPDFDARKTHTLIVEASGEDTYKISVLTADGKLVRSPFVETYDGKETDGTSPGLKRRMERIDAHHLRETYTSAKGERVEDIVVSADGNTSTISQKGTNTSTGAPVNEVSIYTRYKK